jgi:repressor LexA
VGYSSPRSAALLIDELVAAGYLAKRVGGRIQLLDVDDGSATTVNVPIVGSAPCGAPLLAEENIEARVRVDSRLARTPYKYFIVRAAGDSMNQRGIEDRNLVLVRSTNDAHDGDRVVALVDGEVTIKVLRRRRDVAVLEPSSSNSAHRSIYATTNLEVQGVVVAVLG